MGHTLFYCFTCYLGKVETTGQETEYKYLNGCQNHKNLHMRHH